MSFGPLTRRQRQMLKNAYDHKQQSDSGMMRPCPRIGDLRVLNGLALRGLMTDDDNGPSPHVIRVWPRWIRITPAGVAEWERITADKQPEESAS